MPIRPTAAAHEEEMGEVDQILGKLFHVGVMTLLLSAVYGVEDLHAR